jgi:hypothetical protein
MLDFKKNIKMKKINNLLIKKAGIAVLFAVMVFSIPSCKKSFTDLEPVNALSTATTFSSAANVELAANGVYNNAALGTYANGAVRGYAFGAASIEQGEMRGEDMVNIATFYQITYQATYDASTAAANSLYMWVNLYALINQANTFIDGVHQALASGVLGAKAAASYEGEARFLRALAHHELLIQYCRPYLDGNGSMPGVPYRTIAITSQAAVAAANTLGRGTVAADYTALLADLDYAEANLPATSAVGGISRATQGAAIALKTRIKLHMGDYAGVITEGAKLGVTGTGPYVSPIGGFKLTASPDGPFYTGIASKSSNNASNTESVFSIANSATANGGVNGALPNMFGPAATAAFPAQGGRNLVCTSPNLYNAPFWVASDTRRTLLQVLQSTAGGQYYFNWKYRDVATESDYAPIIRYAEVILNVAEANSRGGNLVNALAMLNAVRNRAVAVADQYTVVSFPSSVTMTQAILNERRIEFAGEGRRWADIHRLAVDPNFSTGGIPGKILIGQLSGNGSSYAINGPIQTPSFLPIPYSSFKFLFAIPVTETSVNPTLAAQQNPNY